MEEKTSQWLLISWKYITLNFDVYFRWLAVHYFSFYSHPSLHLFFHRSQSNSFFPNFLFTALCAPHSQRFSPSLSVLSRGWSFRYFLKSSAHHVHGYILLRTLKNPLISALSCVLGFSGYFEHNECMNVHDEFPNLSTSGGSSLYLSFVTGAGTFPVAIWKSSSVLHDLHGFPSLSYMIFLPDAPTAGFVWFSSLMFSWLYCLNGLVLKESWSTLTWKKKKLLNVYHIYFCYLRTDFMQNHPYSFRFNGTELPLPLGYSFVFPMNGLGIGTSSFVSHLNRVLSGMDTSFSCVPMPALFL